MRAGAAALALTTLAIAPAAAESGGFTSFIQGAQAGFLSQVWHDYDHDNVDTKIYFGSCDRSRQEVGVYRQQFGIDPNYGTRVLCGGRTGMWGDMPADDYRFKLESGSYIDVGIVRVSW